MEILYSANASRIPYWLTHCDVSWWRHIGRLLLNWYTCPEVPDKFGYPKSLHIGALTWLRYPFKASFWCYISVGGHAGVTSVQSFILADYNQNFSCGWDSPDTKFQLYQWPKNHVPLTLYVEILFSANALRTPYWVQGGILADYDQIGTHVPKWNPDKFGYPKCLTYELSSDWNTPQNLFVYAIYP